MNTRCVRLGRAESPYDHSKTSVETCTSCGKRKHYKGKPSAPKKFAGI